VENGRKNFAGALFSLVEHLRMRFRALLAFVSLPVVAVSLFAEGPSSAEIAFDGLSISSFDATTHQPLLAQSSPFIGTSNRFLAPITFGQMSLLSYPEQFGLIGATPLDYWPTTFVSPYGPQSMRRLSPGSYRDLPSFLQSFGHASGEVGFFYGKGTGKSDLEATSGYVIGEIDNGNTQISVGASYNKVSARQQPR
jgi:hypothetical protein